jgi:3-methyl-2-oxobutanoate hydroxymethyltransferase
MDVGELRALKGVRKAVMLTAYDYQMAKILDSVGVDMILVGDSLGMVVLGYEGTKQVTMADMIRHTEAVARGAKSAIIVGDMPIGTYDGVGEALRNAQKFIDAGAHAVKLEGNKPEVVGALVSSGMPVMGHLGLLPQTADRFKVKGKDREEAERIHADAKELDDLGVFSLVLECVPIGLSKRITKSVRTLTIGIGAGAPCDGQVLVVNDLLGMDEGFKPKHVKRYANLNETIKEAVLRYMEEVQSGRFPDDAHSFH